MVKKIIFRTIILFLWITAPAISFAKVSQQYADSLARKLNLAEDCSNCNYYASEHSTAALVNTIIIAALVLVGGLWLYNSHKKKYILILSVLVSGLIAASYFAAPYIYSQKADALKNCPVNPEKSSVKTNANTFVSPGDEFQSGDTQDSDSKNTVATITSAKTDSFSAAASDEFSQSAGSDEFSETKTDEFSGSSGEFSQTKTLELSKNDANTGRKINRTMIYEPLAIFLILALIGWLIKYEWFRKTRGFFLVASIVYLGFYRGACSCMISSFQNGVLMIFGVPVPWESLLWFLILIPATYLFGKVWCGWLCHLGALQELIGRTSKFNFLSTRKAQKTLKIIQLSVLIIWIIQLLVTRTNLYCQYDPFKVAYNLLSASWIGWALLGLLISSSLLIHRPFCRTVCPVGIILGWVSLIPGAKKLNKEQHCINCQMCSNKCAVKALINENKATTLNDQDCIMCGECMNSCKKHDALQVKRKFSAKKAGFISLIALLFISQSASAQWECPSRLGVALKPIGGSNLMWSSEIITSGGIIGDYKIANLMGFVGFDYSINHHTFYLEGGVKNWIRNDSLNITNSNILKFGIREAFYRYSDDKSKFTIGLQSTKSDDYYLINERMVGANYSTKIGNFNLNILGGSVLKQAARNGNFCTVGYLINVVPGRKRALIGSGLGQTNLSMISLTYKPQTDNSEFGSEFSGGDSKKKTVALDEIGALAYYEFGSETQATPFITGLYSTIVVSGINLKPEVLLQTASNNNALLYNIEANKEFNWSNGQLTKAFVKYYGLKEVSANAIALNSYSNVFAGEVLRYDALELPFFQTGIKHSFPSIKSSIKLQAALQTGKTTGYITDTYSTTPSRMKEFDLSFSKNFGKYVLVNAFVGYIEHPTLSLYAGDIKYVNDSSPWGKIEIRFTF